MFEYDMLEYPPSKLVCRKSLSLLKCSFYKPIWFGNLLILFYNNLTRINRSTKSKLCNGLTGSNNVSCESTDQQDPTDQQDGIE